MADAVHHALAASDWGQAAVLITGASGMLLERGEVATLVGWFRALPEEEVRGHPGLCLNYSWPLILTDQIEAAESHLAQAEQMVQASEEDDPVFRGEIAAARAYVARVRGDNDGVIDLSQQALSLLPRDELSGRSVVVMNLGMTHWYRGSLAEAEDALAEAERTAGGSGNDYAWLTARVFLSRIQAARGRLRQAAESYRLVIEQGTQSPMVTLACADLGRLLYERNDLE
ncbi:MAG: hypothetical protein GY832_28190 [Chloroflexi bacterium]|nr:hypothetical protein [Chloroflexota bacterium]